MTPVARWDGDTLVVDTTGLNDKTFIDDEGSSHSTQEHVIERYRKIDGGSKLELHRHRGRSRHAGEASTATSASSTGDPTSGRMEYVCEENNRNAPVNGITSPK